jgi:polysaccharide export outer membrane protein
MSQPVGGAQVSSPRQFKAYRINPGDDLEINVWGEERLQREVKVLPDGTFTFPLVGQIIAVNKLPSEIAVDITNGLKAQYRDNVPTVTVSVKTAGGFQFSVTGKVKGPGVFTPSRYVNVLDALIMAGGPAEFANVDNVTIVRKLGNGHSTAIKVHLSSVFKGNPSARDMADLPELESGDTVVVP